MAQIQKLLSRFLAQPSPKDFTWQELVKLLSHFGYEEFKGGNTGGSRRKFVNVHKRIIHLHKPHPSQILKQYMISDVVEHLKQEGLL